MALYIGRPGRRRRCSPGVSPRSRLPPVPKPPAFSPSAGPCTSACRPAWRPDVLVVVAYGLILPPAALSIPRLGCVNIHASLLPRWLLFFKLPCGNRKLLHSSQLGETCPAYSRRRRRRALPASLTVRRSAGYGSVAKLSSRFLNTSLRHLGTKVEAILATRPPSKCCSRRASRNAVSSPTIMRLFASTIAPISSRADFASCTLPSLKRD